MPLSSVSTQQTTIQVKPRNTQEALPPNNEYKTTAKSLLNAKSPYGTSRWDSFCKLVMYDAVLRKWKCTNKKQVQDILKSYYELCKDKPEVVAKWRSWKEEYNQGIFYIDDIRELAYNDNEIPSINEIDNKPDSHENPTPEQSPKEAERRGHNPNLMELEEPCSAMNDGISHLLNNNSSDRYIEPNQDLEEQLWGEPQMTPPRYTPQAPQRNLSAMRAQSRQYYKETQRKAANYMQANRQEECYLQEDQHNPSPQDMVLIERALRNDLKERYNALVDRNLKLEAKQEILSERLISTEVKLIKMVDSHRDILNN